MHSLPLYVLYYRHLVLLKMNNQHCNGEIVKAKRFQRLQFLRIARLSSLKILSLIFAESWCLSENLFHMAFNAMIIRKCGSTLSNPAVGFNQSILKE